MPWNSINPNGGVSVKANETIGQQNTTYTETTMNNDHYWNIGSNEDGRHKYVNMPVQGSDPSISTGMSGIVYLKSDGSRVQGFYRNVNGIYEFIPAFLSGTHFVTGSFTNMVAVPDNVYGEIVMFRSADAEEGGQSGFFKCQGGECQAWSYGLRIQGSSTALYNLRFGNGSDASGLNVRVVADNASSNHTWNYRITYRAI